MIKDFVSYFLQILSYPIYCHHSTYLIFIVKLLNEIKQIFLPTTILCCMAVLKSTCVSCRKFLCKSKQLFVYLISLLFGTFIVNIGAA
jgi:hypothetical protein